MESYLHGTSCNFRWCYLGLHDCEQVFFIFRKSGKILYISLTFWRKCEKWLCLWLHCYDLLYCSYGCLSATYSLNAATYSSTIPTVLFLGYTLPSLWLYHLQHAATGNLHFATRQQLLSDLATMTIYYKTCYILLQEQCDSQLLRQHCYKDTYILQYITAVTLLPLHFTFFMSTMWHYRGISFFRCFCIYMYMRVFFCLFSLVDGRLQLLTHTTAAYIKKNIFKF